MHTLIRAGIVRSIFFDNDDNGVIVEEYSRIRRLFFMNLKQQKSVRALPRRNFSPSDRVSAECSFWLLLFGGDICCRNRTDEDV